jgi:hypothetical protein
MLLDGGAVSAVSHSGKKPIQPAESSAPQRLLIRVDRQFPADRRLPVIGKYPAGIPLERCERN